jgi:hypothetical protein
MRLLSLSLFISFSLISTDCIDLPLFVCLFGFNLGRMAPEQENLGCYNPTETKRSIDTRYPISLSRLLRSLINGASRMFQPLMDSLTLRFCKCNIMVCTLIKVIFLFKTIVWKCIRFVIDCSQQINKSLIKWEHSIWPAGIEF